MAYDGQLPHRINQNAQGGECIESKQGLGGHSWKVYLRFGAMIFTGMVVMYWVMLVGSWEWSHVRFSESRVFMTIIMGGMMGPVMLAWMLNMYKFCVGPVYRSPPRLHADHPDVESSRES